MVYILSLLPIVILIILSLSKGVKTAVSVGLAITTILFFYWGATFNHFFAALSVSLVASINILMIVFGAAFLYNIMSHTGVIEDISHSLDNLHPSKEIRFFLLALCLTAFFEGVAGFGTPGAIVPLLLMALGFDAVLSVSVVLLFDGLFAVFGAVGTPIITGLQLPLKLSPEEVKSIGTIAAILSVLAQTMILFFIFRLFKKNNNPVVNKKQVFILFSFFAVPFCVFAYVVTDLATVLAALVMLGLSVFYLSKGKVKINLRPWIPYAVLAILLLLPKLIRPLSRQISWELAFNDLFGTGIHTAIKPLQSPMIPFIMVALGVAFFKKSRSLHLSETAAKIANVFIVLFPSIAIAQLMINSGVTQPSMIRYMSELFSAFGQAYVMFASFIGVTGAFITGSTTISNVVFGPSQLETALSLKASPVVLLSLQLAGAALGNAICLFNIIAAASIANLKSYKEILANNLWPTLAGGLLMGLIGWVLLYV